MKFNRLLCLLFAEALAFCLMSCSKTETDSPYDKAVAALGDEEAYAFLMMDYEYPVMVSTDLVYDDGGAQESVYGDVYYYVNGEAKLLGAVMSDSTATPISFTKDAIYVATHRGVEKYVIDEKTGVLYVDESVLEEFDDEGESIYYKESDGVRKEISEEDFLMMFEEYGQAMPIHFSYGANECVNELP